VSPEAVTFVNIFPFEYKTRSNVNGTEMEVEVIIHALSSQHQGSLFCVLIEVKDDLTNAVSRIASAPLKVVSKTDSLSAPVITQDGERKTMTEMLVSGLRVLEFNECQKTKMIATLCKESGVEATDHRETSKPIDLGALVKRLCDEYRIISKGERGHRLKCEMACLMHDDLVLLSRVNEAFSASFQEVFDANYELIKSNRKAIS